MNTWLALNSAITSSEKPPWTNHLKRPQSQALSPHLSSQTLSWAEILVDLLLSPLPSNREGASYGEDGVETKRPCSSSSLFQGLWAKVRSLKQTNKEPVCVSCYRCLSRLGLYLGQSLRVQSPPPALFSAPPAMETPAKHTTFSSWSVSALTFLCPNLFLVPLKS